MEYCALCSQPFSASDSSRKYRKLLYGKSCSKELAILNSLIFTTWPGLSVNSFEKLCEDKAYLCAPCQKGLINYNKAFLKVNQLSSNLLSNLSVPSQTGPTSRPRTGDKRSAETANLEEVQESNGATTSTTDSTQRSRTDSPQPSTTDSTQPLTPQVTVKIKGKDGRIRNHHITPRRAPIVTSLSRRSFNATSEKVVESEDLHDRTIHALAVNAREEMKALNSPSHKSLLRESSKELEKFSWESLSSELKHTVPTLWMFLDNLLPNAKEKFICFIVSMILKMQCKQLCQVQKAVSMMLYANGVHKQVFRCLQPFMVTVSVTTVANTVRSLSDRHDADVISWASNLLMNIDMARSQPQAEANQFLCLDAADGESVNDDTSSCCSEYSVGNISSLTESENDDGDLFDDFGFDDFDFDDIDFDLSDLRQADGRNETCGPSPTCDNTATAVEPPPLTPSLLTLSPARSLTTAVSQPPCTNGYVIVGDNIDKNVRPSFQRHDRTTQSLHFFHSYAVLDRIDIDGLSDDHPSSIDISLDKILPSADDLEKLLGEFEVLVARILVQSMDQFKDQQHMVTWHIPSKYSKEMSCKSNVVPLGVTLKNETKLKEMTEVLDTLSEYVPVHVATKTVSVEGKDYTIDDSRLIQILFFGDQLTAARARGAIALRDDDISALHRLEGFVPAVADWHARMCLLQAMWTRLYTSKSSRDKGTLYQIRNLIHRTAIKNDPSKNMKATEDFLMVVLHGYIVAGATKLINDEPTAVSSCCEIAKSLVSRWIKISLPSSITDVPPKGTDYGYALDIMSLGLLWHGFHDAVREGDGDRIIRYWRFLMPVFRQCGRRNYACEAFKLLTQVVILSPRQAAELKWGRTVNTVGRVGHNIPCDLHMEHLNRRLKFMMENLGSNIKPQCVQTVGQTLGVISKLCSHFEDEADATKNKSYHTFPTFKKDLAMIVSQLVSDDVLSENNPRKLSSYKKKAPLFQTINWKSVTEWLQKKILKLDLYSK